MQGRLNSGDAHSETISAMTLPGGLMTLLEGTLRIKASR